MIGEIAQTGLVVREDTLEGRAEFRTQEALLDLLGIVNGSELPAITHLYIFTIPALYVLLITHRHVHTLPHPRVVTSIIAGLSRIVCVGVRSQQRLFFY